MDFYTDISEEESGLKDLVCNFSFLSKKMQPKFIQDINANNPNKFKKIEVEGREYKIIEPKGIEDDEYLKLAKSFNKYTQEIENIEKLQEIHESNEIYEINEIDESDENHYERSSSNHQKIDNITLNILNKFKETLNSKNIDDEELLDSKELKAIEILEEEIIKANKMLEQKNININAREIFEEHKEFFEDFYLKNPDTLKSNELREIFCDSLSNREGCVRKASSLRMSSKKN